MNSIIFVLQQEIDDLSVCVPVFTRSLPARSRSSTCSSSSGIDTPPLSASDGSSNSGGFQSSIDLSQLNIALANATHPMSNIARNRAHARAHGTGHCRRYSKAHMSRSQSMKPLKKKIPILQVPHRWFQRKMIQPLVKPSLLLMQTRRLFIRKLENPNGMMNRASSHCANFMPYETKPRILSWKANVLGWTLRFPFLQFKVI